MILRNPGATPADSLPTRTEQLNSRTRGQILVAPCNDGHHQYHTYYFSGCEHDERTSGGTQEHTVSTMQCSGDQGLFGGGINPGLR